MELNNFHKSFRLNNNSFNSVNELINYSETISKELYFFLNDWFSTSQFIEVQTSGSTGTPKTIFLKKEFVINSAKATGNFLKLEKNTSALLCLPVQYIAGKLMVVRALTLGWHLDFFVPSLSPLKNVNKQYDFSAMTPMQLENSLSKINLIKKLIVGGVAVSNQLNEKLKNISTKVFATYGMTETITHIALKQLNHLEVQPNFYTLLPNVTIYKDQKNCLVINAPKISESIIFTNDVVDLVATNQFEWLGRFDNVINSGGIKLHPEIIEEKLSATINSRFFVAGVPDNYLGEKLILLVEGTERKIDLKGTSLTKFETPKNIYFVENFSETATGKINRIETIFQLKKFID